MAWLTRLEAAAYLKVSTRQLDRLRLPRSFVGKRPRYATSDLDTYLEQLKVTPPQRGKGGRVRPPRYRPNRGRPLEWEKRADEYRRALRKG